MTLKAQIWVAGGAGILPAPPAPDRAAADGSERASEWVSSTRMASGCATFKAAVAAARLPDFTWHCLRHTFASRLVMMGVDPRTVQELMGHKDIRMTCRYAHLAPGHKPDAAELLVSWGQGQGLRPGAQEPPPCRGGGLSG